MATIADLIRESTRDAKRREMTHDDSFRRGQDLMRDTTAKAGKRVRDVAGTIDSALGGIGDLLLPQADLGSRYNVGYDEPTGQWEQVGDSPEAAQLKTIAALFPTGSLSDAAQGGKAVLRTFGGMRAKTADLEAQKLAEVLESKGIAPEKIWQETGWYRAPWDRKWRFEIDDSGAKITDKAWDGAFGEGNRLLPMDQAINHQGLNQAYDMDKIGFMWADNLGDASGNYSRGIINISPGADNPRSTALHELQHVTQKREGFTGGGTPSEFGDYAAALERAKANGGFDPITGDADFVIEEDLRRYGSNPFDAYRRLAGEAEARAVQARMNLTPEQRRARFPLEDFDVKPEDMIVRYGDGPNMSVPKSVTNLDPALSYGMDHRPMSITGGAAPLHDLERAFPDDIYSPQALQYYGSGDPREREALRLMKAVRGKPNAPVSIYRGVPEGISEINPGDWVTLSRKVAEEYGPTVLERKVPANDVSSWPDSLLEFGYYPEGHHLRADTGLSDPAMALAKLAVGAPEFRAATIADLQDSLSRMRMRNVDKGLDEDIGTGAIRDEIARRNAVDMLGLPEGNTATDRARKMGFIDNYYHETEADNLPSLTEFNPRMVKAAASDEQTPYAVFLKNNPNNIGIARNPVQMPLLSPSTLSDGMFLEAFHNRHDLQSHLDSYPQLYEATKKVRDYDQSVSDYADNIMTQVDALEREGKKQEADALMEMIGDSYFDDAASKTKELASNAKQLITDHFKNRGVSHLGLTNDAGSWNRNVLTTMVLDPKNIRSRFAAFDPKLRNSANLLATNPYGLSPYALTDQEDDRQHLTLADLYRLSR